MYYRNGNTPGQRDNQIGRRNRRGLIAPPAHPGNPFYLLAALLFRLRRRTIRTMIKAIANTAAIAEI
jgi:hypothetical protein